MPAGIDCRASGTIAAKPGRPQNTKPAANLDPLSTGLIAAAIILALWLANKYRAYRTCHVIFTAEDDRDVIRHFNRTIKKYGREIIGGIITLCISLIVLFITWFFHLA